MQKILVIEDEADLRENLLDLLSAEGFEAVGADNGQIGVQLAQELMPDLVICDVLMPELNGHDVLAILRQNPETALVPFIFLTAKGTAADFRTGLRLGADDYLTKPYKQAELMDAVMSRLNKQAAIQRVQQIAMEQLQQKIEELQQSNLLKDDFLSTASHELRSPMTNIKLAIQILQQMPRNEQQQRYLDLLQAECSREIELINDLLDLQRLEVSPIPCRAESIVWQEWLPSVIRPFEARTQARQQILTIDLQPDHPSFCTIPSDLHRLLTELLNNACKYTAADGKIELQIQGHNPVQITVGNTAEISAKDLRHLFERFYRVPMGDRWNQGGTGLGLALAKKLVERLDGSIDVTSKQGWTEFHVRLPALLHSAGGSVLEQTEL